MPLRQIRNEFERRQLLKYLENQKLPYTVDIINGRRRSIEQNRLQRLWLTEISMQCDYTPEEVRGYCKLHFGVPILRHANEGFRVKYDEIIRPMSYAAKIELMMVPLDLPVTRIMTVEQKTEYLEVMFRHWSEAGLILTSPPDKWRKAA